jgi:hypothetical protein
MLKIEAVKKRLEEIERRMPGKYAPLRVQERAVLDRNICKELLLRMAKDEG